jgi:hypothetical protein
VGFDRPEQVPIGLPGVEQRADPVVPEAGEPEGGALDPLDQIVDCLGGSVADLGGVPGGDLVHPSVQRSSEGSGLCRIVPVLEVTAELSFSDTGRRCATTILRPCSGNRTMEG